MPRENSFSDSDGVSLTPDLSDAEDNDAPAAVSPTYSGRQRIPSPVQLAAALERTQSNPGRPSQAGSSRVVPVSPVRPTQRPIDRFRSAARKVMAMRRSTSMMVSGGVGGEPGVDPRRASADAQFGKVRADCVIQVVDYSSLKYSYGRMTNKEFVNLMADQRASKREPWAKVRWINIGGLSWDVMKAVSLKYDIHPLALEDVFHARANTRSKADYYPKHLFLRVLCHELGHDDEDEEERQMRCGTAAVAGSTLVDDIDIPRSSSPEPLTEEDKMKMDFMDEDKTLYYGSAPPSRTSTTNMRNRRNKMMARDVERGRGGLFSFIPTRTDTRRKRVQEAEVKVQALKKGEKVNVRQTPFFIFLYRDGTVITMHRYPDLAMTQPILQRLQQRDTGLRTSSDPSLLVQSLLDLIVDKAVVVIEEFEAKIKGFESRILLRPDVSTVRNLHIFSEDLILLKRTLEPIKVLVYGLRRYDLDRCAALVDPSRQGEAKVEGYMSHKSKIYLADVYDHMEYVLSSLDMFAAISENLINYTFNMTSYEMNEVMRRLTLATIVFLPLTLLTGYFGMNFEPMWSVNQNSDLLFWKIAIPVMAVVIPTFLMPDIKRVLRFIQKRMQTKQAVKTLKTA